MPLFHTYDTRMWIWTRFWTVDLVLATNTLELSYLSQFFNNYKSLVLLGLRGLNQTKNKFEQWAFNFLVGTYIWCFYLFLL